MKTQRSKFKSPRPAADGFVLVAVLWILGALSAAVSTYAFFIIDTAKGLPVHDERLQSEALVSAALELTAFRQLSIDARSRPTRGQFGFALGAAYVTVEFRSEAARVDLNAAPKALLAGLFAALGARTADAELYSDRLVAWRSAQTKNANSTVGHQSHAPIGYRPREGKFPHPDEMLLVRELPPALAQRALPFVTVYSGRPQVNVMDAAPQVLAALPGMSDKLLNAILAQRQAAPDNRELVLQLLGPANQFATLEGTNSLRVTVYVAFDNGRQSRSEVVILLFEEGDEPFSIFSWRDEGVTG